MCRREDNIKVNLGEVGHKYMDWIHLAQDNNVQWWTFVNTVMGLRVQQTQGNS
jgi:hypothetical protein